MNYLALVKCISLFSKVISFFNSMKERLSLTSYYIRYILHSWLGKLRQYIYSHLANTKPVSPNNQHKKEHSMRGD